MKIVTALVLTGSLLTVGVTFSGCSAMNTAIKKRNLEVSTKMSETIFLEPVAPEERIVYFDIRNTSDKEINVKKNIVAAFTSRGYKVTDNPKEATYMLQGNILKVGKSDLREAQSFLGSGFGAGVTGAATGVAATAALGGGNRSMAAVGLAGAALGFVGDALVEDTMYAMITDLQIRERPLEGEIITQTQKANLAQGSSTQVKQDIRGGKVKWKTYRTRIVSTANKMNLDFEEARPVLENALAKSMSGIF